MKNEFIKQFAYLSSRRIGFIYSLGSILLVSFAQILLKYSTLNITHFDFSVLHNQDFIIAFLFAGGFYLASILLWMQALSRLPLNIAYPLLSLSYPLVYIIAASVNYFGEEFSPQRNIGVVLITLGVIIGSRK